MTTSPVTDHFIGIADVLHLTAIKSKSTIYSLVHEGKFPRPYAVTEARRAWSALEVSAWIEARKKSASPKLERPPG